MSSLVTPSLWAAKFGMRRWRIIAGATAATIADHLASQKGVTRVLYCGRAGRSMSLRSAIFSATETR